MAIVINIVFHDLGPGEMENQDADSWRRWETKPRMSYDLTTFMVYQSLQISEHYLSSGSPCWSYSIICFASL